MDSLFIKKIKTPNQFYIYDVCSNEIIKVNRIIWDIIDQFQKPIKEIIHRWGEKYSQNEILHAYQLIRNAKESGYFSNNRPKIRSDRKNKTEISYLFENAGIQQLILDLTNQCNMRCKYCTFSGKYKYQRNHSDRKINRDIAIKVVDYFIKNCDKKERPFLTFYGGEPFLRFELFKDIIEYTKSHNKNFHYSLTTNGTLLNKKKIYEYLIENDISINISLDGPKEIHDKNRVMVNGEGSFDRIIENLSRIKKLAPDYFLKNVFFSPVVTPPYNFDAINAFFYKSDFFKNYKNPLNLAPVSLFATNFLNSSEIHTAKLQYRKNRNKMLDYYKKALILGQYDDLILERKLFKDIINTIHFRKKTQLGKYITVVGQCTPGIRRLFVSADGQFYICEKIGEYYSIGDVDTGLNLEKIFSFFEECDDFFKECSNCWAVRLCKRCFADANCKDQFDEKRMKKFCKSKLSYLETIMSAYCEILEANPNAFELFKPEEIL